MPYTADEAALLREARRWMRTTAAGLELLRRPARDLLGRLEHTAEYRRAVQLSDEHREDEGNALPAYAVAAALDNLLRDLDESCDYLRDAARVNRKRAPRK